MGHPSISFHASGPSVEAVGVQVFFALLLHPGQHGAEHQVDDGQLTVDRQELIGVGGHPLGGHEHLGDGDVGRQGGVLDHADQGVGQRRERGAQRLRHDDPAHDLPPGHPHAVARLQLAGRHRLQRGADGLGAIGPLVDGEGDHRRGESVQHDPHAGQPVKDDEQLDQQRGAPHHPDVHPGQLAQHRHPGKLHQGHRRRDHHGKREGQHRQRDGHRQARQQNAGERFDQHLNGAVLQQCFDHRHQAFSLDIRQSETTLL